MLVKNDKYTLRPRAPAKPVVPGSPTAPCEIKNSVAVFLTKLI